MLETGPPDAQQAQMPHTRGHRIRRPLSPALCAPHSRGKHAARRAPLPGPGLGHKRGTSRCDLRCRRCSAPCPHCTLLPQLLLSSAACACSLASLPSPNAVHPVIQASLRAEGGQLCAEARQLYEYTADGSSWRAALYSMMAQLPLHIKQAVQSVAVDATSSTALLIDRRTGTMLAPPKMYFEAQPEAALAALQVCSTCVRAVYLQGLLAMIAAGCAGHCTSRAWLLHAHVYPGEAAAVAPAGHLAAGKGVGAGCKCLLAMLHDACFETGTSAYSFGTPSPWSALWQSSSAGRQESK